MYLELVLAFAAIFSGRCVAGTDSTTVRYFPDGFKFGVATAAYQIEGAWNVSDKTESIWDHVLHQNTAFTGDGTNGDVACDSYNNYKRDVQMIKSLGVNHYRFSISWPRILPNGFANVVSEDGCAYYNNLIDELITYGIEPMVTIYHWDLPLCLHTLGGWANPLIADWLEDYARVLFTKFGDRVKTWITINEPKQICLYAYGQKRFAPALGYSGVAEYICAKNLLLAHARVWHLYNDEFKPTQNGDCGIVIASDWRTNATASADDVEAGLDAHAFEVELYAQPIYSETGGFPERVINRITTKCTEQGYTRSRLPTLSDTEIAYIKGTYDFYGFNHYSSRFYYRNSSLDGTFAVPSYDDDLGVGNYYISNFAAGASSFLKVIPFGIRDALNSVRIKYNNPKVIITENGFSNYGGLEDDDRISYFRQYMDNVLNAIDDGCNVVAYTYWSLMDNLSWKDGLNVRYGLFEVDYDSDEKTRTARKSAYVFQNIAETGCLDPSYVPVLSTNITY